MCSAVINLLLVISCLHPKNVIRSAHPLDIFLVAVLLFLYSCATLFHSQHCRLYSRPAHYVIRATTHSFARNCFYSFGRKYLSHQQLEPPVQLNDPWSIVFLFGHLCVRVSVHPNIRTHTHTHTHIFSQSQSKKIPADEINT